MLRRSPRLTSRTRTNARWRWLAYITSLIMLAVSLPMSLALPESTSARQETGRTFTWIVEKRECPPGFDPASADLALAFNTCPPTPGAQFTLSSDNPDYPGDTRTAGDSGPAQATWTDLPADTTYIVTEQVPPGYGQPTVRCALYADPGNPAAGGGNPGFGYGPGSAGAYLPADTFEGLNTVLCRFYNVPPAPNGEGETPPQTGDLAPGSGSILLRKYSCVPAYNEEELTRELLMDQCLAGLPGARFRVTAGTGQPQTVETNEFGEGTYAPYPGGPVTIQEEDVAWPHPMRPIVYCAVQTNGATPELVDVEPGGRITYDLPPGQSLACDWFNIFVHTGVHVLKLACPEGVDPAASDLALLRERCTPQPDVKFSVDVQSETGGTSTTGLSGEDGRTRPTIAWFSDPSPVYQTSIEETMPDGYVESRVFCSLARHGEYPEPLTEVQLTGPTSYSFEQPWASVIACAWFNFLPFKDDDGEQANGQPPAAYGEVVVHKSVCLGTYPSGGTYDDYRAACANSTEGSGYEFTVAASEYGYQESKTTGEDGQAQWPEVPAGSIEIHEHSAPGYRPVAVFCGSILIGAEGSPTGYSEVPLAGSSVMYDLDEGWRLDCRWFNAPAEDGITLIINKRVCPDGYNPDSASDMNAILAACMNPQSGITFHLEEENQPVTQAETDTSGAATLPYSGGLATLQEEISPGYQTAAFYCSADGGQSYARISPSSENSYVINGGGLAPGTVIDCYWFNLPLQNGVGDLEPGHVEIRKYICPTGYDYDSADLAALVDACGSMPQQGVGYQADDGNGGATSTTDSEGYAALSDLHAGPVTVSETVPDGYRAMRVFCNAVDAGAGVSSFSDYEQMVLSDGRNISFDLPAGSAMDCYWFNAPVEVDQDGYGSVTIYKLVCPDGYDPANYSRDYLVSTCTDPHTGIEFSLEREGSPAETASVSMDGTAHWSSVPAGWIDITEDSSDGYMTVGVYCDDYPMNGMPGDYQGMTIVDGSAVSYQLPEGYSLSCYWYNAPYDDDEYGTVSLTKYLCPEGYDPHSVSPDYLASSCTAPQDGVEFLLYRDGGSSEPMTTSASGEATWEQVYGGPLELREMLMDGHQPLRVYCAAYPIGDQPSDYQSMPVSDGMSVYYDLAPGYSLACLWYNAPVAGGWIELTKYACPENYDPASGSSMSIADSCRQPVEGVEFSLEPMMDGEGEHPSASTDSMGVATFEDVPYGVSYNLTERYPDGYNAAVVYCSRYVPHYGAMTVYEPYAVSNGAVSLSLNEGEYLKCRWYNLAAPYGADVLLNKYSCPDDAWEASGADLAELCDTPMPHVRFYLTSGDLRIAGTTSSMGTVGWEGVSAGVVRIEEVAPEGYGNRIRVYCATTMDDEAGMWQSVAIQGGVGIEYGVAAGQTLECRWYNFPIVETGAGIAMTKYLCDPNADLISVARLSLKSRCVPLAGVQFSLATSGEPAWSRLTGPSGMARWDGVPGGEFGLAERTTSGYRTPVVYCSLNEGSWERVHVSGGSIRYDVADDDQLRCEWFNVPATHVQGPVAGPTVQGTGPGAVGQVPLGGGNAPGQPAPGGSQGTGPASLTIVSYLCPQGYDLYAAESDPRTECDAGEEPISFTLAPWGGDATGDTTTVEGEEPEPNVVTFSEIDAGDYLVSLVPPTEPEITRAFVLSCESSLGQSDSTRFYPLALTGDNLGLRLALYPGEDLECSWYNVPAGGTTVMVTVYECPGQVANPSRCSLAERAHSIDFLPDDQSQETVSVETAEEGSATTQLEPGVYEVVDQTMTTCLVDSNSIDDDGNLNVGGNEAIEVVVYTCSG